MHDLSAAVTMYIVYRMSHFLGIPILRNAFYRKGKFLESVEHNYYTQAEQSSEYTCNPQTPLHVAI